MVIKAWHYLEIMDFLTASNHFFLEPECLFNFHKISESMLRVEVTIIIIKAILPPIS